MSTLNRTIQSGGERTWQQLFLEARNATDYPTFQALGRARRKLAAGSVAPDLPTHARVALLSGATTSLLATPLQLCLEALGVGCTIHESAFNAFAREMLDAESETVRFNPDVAVIIATPASLPAWPKWNASESDVDAIIDEVCDYWFNLCRSLHDHAGCSIILPNFHLLPVRPLGTAGTRNVGEANRFVRALNEALARRAPDFVHINDVASLAAFYGVYRWFDPRFWYVARQPVSFECLVPYVRNIAQIIAALRGRSAKCVVLDLDNTLWGGVVGDDGAERLALGEGDPRGEAFCAFQRYLLTLKERGVMLAVSSKNEEAAALAPFGARPEMVLKRADFVAFRANWQPKSENVREIASTLNIGLDSIIFVDDNPAEREQVRQALPDVRVVELGEDPSDFATLLDRTGWLDTVALSAEDLARSRSYQENEARESLHATVSDYGAYVRSLQQRAVIGPFEERFLDRIAQLTGKTNQFNLTTRRRSRPELAAMMNSTKHITAYVRLTDRFGDNGLISVLAADGNGADLWIDLWLMSCRVFSRGVEQLLCNYLVASASKAGYRRIHGLYLPTERNALVKGHYGTMGFEPDGVVDGGDHWTLDVEKYRPFETTIHVVDNY